GVQAGFYSTLLALLTAVTIVVGMRMMGALLISSLIIFPSLSAMRIFSSFRAVVAGSAVISVVCFLAGMAGSYLWTTPAGASVVMANLAAFLLCGAGGAMLRRD
ncbi:MAG: metal ABC transporter permease, partial [Oscillospiraceae bacterium]